MPYDPRPVSQGGNRGIDEEFERSSGKFRVVGVDTFDGGDWVQGDFDTLEEARKCAKEHGGTMTLMYVYGPDRDCLFSAGSF